MECDCETPAQPFSNVTRDSLAAPIGNFFCGEFPDARDVSVPDAREAVLLRLRNRFGVHEADENLIAHRRIRLVLVG